MTIELIDLKNITQSIPESQYKCIVVNGHNLKFIELEGAVEFYLESCKDLGGQPTFGEPGTIKSGNNEIHIHIHYPEANDVR